MVTKSANDLMALIALGETDQSTAEQAFDEFYKRFHERLEITCLYLCKKYQVTEFEEVAKDVKQETLLKIYFRASQFNQVHDASVKQQENGLLRWVAGIVANELRQFLRKKVDVLLDPKMEYLLTESPEKEIIVSKSDELKIKLINETINELNQRDSDIIRTWLNYYPNKMDRKEIDRLATTYGVSKSNIRKIKQRCAKKVKQIVLYKYDHTC